MVYGGKKFKQHRKGRKMMSAKKIYPEAVVFDLDGTLVDSLGAHYEAVKAVFEHERLPFADERVLAGQSHNSFHKLLQNKGSKNVGRGVVADLWGCI